MVHFSVQDLTFSYPETDRLVLNHVSLDIRAGQYITLCGRSGCGKTTLLRHLKSVLTPYGNRSGQVLFKGQPLDDVPQIVQSCDIGYVMQNPDNQVVTDKVWHELAFGLESVGFDQRTMRLRVAEMASYFGIQQWFHKDVRDLSGGQKQLLNLASIMAMQPTALILDEPTSQLDPIAASDFLNTVRKINLELGTTIILTEHRLEEVFSVADRVVVMAQGQIIADDSPRKVGDILYERGDDMLPTLPAPMRIYYGVKDANRSVKDAVDVTAPDSLGDCPMTVREGRTWLSDRYSSALPAHRAVPDEMPFDDSTIDAALRVKDVWFRYKRDLPDVLKGANVTVPRGTLFAMVGGNGTGKSTTLRVMCGTERPYRGTVEILGRKMKDWSKADLYRGCISMLPQDPQNIFVKSTVRADLEEMLVDLHLSPEERDRQVEEIAEAMEISHVLESHPFDLSGGEQQRAGLAKVLLTEPKILLLDEPTKGVDNLYKQRLAHILSKLTDQGTTIIMVSHDVEFCARYADTVSMFFDGSVVTTNTPHRFFSQNSFYTTAANRMSRHVFENAVVDADVIALCNENPPN